MKFLKYLILFVPLLAISCASSNYPIHLLCSERHVELYINDEYIGREQVTYIVPKGIEYILVSCQQNGVEIYSKKLYVKGQKNRLFEINIPKNYNYSVGKNKLK